MRISRRSFIRVGTAAAIFVPVLKSWSATGRSAAETSGSSRRTLSLDQDWLFGGKLDPAALERGFDESSFTHVTLPHCVTPLSWQNWDPSSWQDIWVYRRHFALPPELGGLRHFLRFDRAMIAAIPTVNGHALPQHLGGFLPFEHEVTGLLREKDNVLSVAVDSRWSDIPPEGSPKGPPAVDYLLPGGITGSVTLRAFPSIFISDVFAKPVDVLTSNCRLELNCAIDAGTNLPATVRLLAELRDQGRIVSRISQDLSLEESKQEIALTLAGLKHITLWDPDQPHLYDVVVTLFLHDKPLHTYRTRVGFREAHFAIDGFSLNGRRLRLFGLDRHELYPYVGFAAPPRALRRDAEILRHSFNCNVVRCSHYPQSEAFLDACDELGLMVWEETPGWQYIGDESWQQLMLDDVGNMIRRDRNHPSIIIWGVRVNESRNDPNLYRRSREIAKSLDDSRPTSGSMTPSSEKNWQQEWHQDVFAFDDYHSAPDGSVGIREPLPGVPYMLAETVGQFNYSTGKGFTAIYRRAADAHLQTLQALRHAQAHDRAAAYPRCAGAIAWCAFEYGSLDNGYHAVKYPGVADVFRIPKLGAAFYLAQVDPKIKPVIEPDFYWDFGPQTPSGPGAHAAIFSNCDRLEVSIQGKPPIVLHPDRAGFPQTKYPPFFADLTLEGNGKPELRIDGYVGSARVLSRSFSADIALDRFWLSADDTHLVADGADATRLAFGVVDKYGVPRPFVGGEVAFKIDGPGVVVGDNPFQLLDSGGMGAVWIKTLPSRTGQISVQATHASLGSHAVTIDVRKA